jgi:hypothetical protein
MKIVIELIHPPCKDGFFDDLSIQPAGAFVEEIEQSLYFLRDAESYHRICTHCLASVHCDIIVREQEDGEFIAMGVPAIICPHCESAKLAEYTDPVFRALDGLAPVESLSEANRYRLKEISKGDFGELPPIVPFERVGDDDFLDLLIGVNDFRAEVEAPEVTK